MKITKDDNHLKKYELKNGLKVTANQNNIFYRIAKNKWQCTHCMKLHSERVSICKCGNESETYIIPRRHSFFRQYFFEVYREKNKSLLKLTFCITTEKTFENINQRIDLVRKVEFGDKLEWLYSSGLQYSQSMGYEQMSYYVRGRWNGPNKWVTGLIEHRAASIWFKEANPQLFDDYYKFEFLKKQNKRFIKLGKYQNIIKYNKELNFLYKRFPELDCTEAIAQIVKYSGTFKKYSKYFSRIGAVDRKTIQRLSWYKEMILYSEFEKMMHNADNFFTKKQISNYKKLKDHLTLLDTKNYFHMADYKDYLTMLKNLNIPITREKLYNKNWRRVHDELVARVKYEKNKEKEDNFKKAMSNLTTYEDKGIYIVPPHSIKEMFKESGALKHCVKTYVDKVIKNESIIVFVRTDPEQPFITAEIQNNQVVQMRGKYNKVDMIQDDHKEVLKNFIKEQITTAAAN